MYWISVRIFIYIIICAGMWYGGQFYSAREMLNTLKAPPSGAIFVDQSIATGTHPATAYFDRYDALTHKLLSLAHLADFSDKHTGTITFPFTTITDALTNARENNIRTVIVAPGTYTESIVIPENTTLYGQNDVIVTYDRLFEKNIIHTNDHATLINMTISGGMNGVSVPYNTYTTLLNVTISDAEDFGVVMGQKDRPTNAELAKQPVVYEILNLSEEEISQIPLLKIKNCTIKKSDKQGLYLFDGRVLIENSRITENGEEGIDLHPHMKVTIINTESSSNLEGGIETEIYDNIITIDNSVFKDNFKSGVAFITSSGIGDITITNSQITNNQAYGMRCAIHLKKPPRPRPFFQNMITEKNNVYEGNILSKHAPECFTF
ncbi:MAG: right-handed parallel beta-helix repeat-containing protein [Parcubacteria group bacterium]|jgi:hypothetical protein